MYFKYRLASCLSITIFIGLYFSMRVNCNECNNLNSSLKIHLSTKTPYNYIANYNDDPIIFKGCTAVRIWSLIRHGTRNPGKISDKMRAHLPALKMIIIDHHESGKGNLCPEVIEKLRSWEPSVDPTELKFLTHEGEDEMLLLGERFLNRFSGLLPEIYSNKTYKFRHTATQRARESAQYFTVGLFGRKQKNYVWYPEPLSKDPVLRFYKLCSRWQAEVDKSPAALVELERFKTSAPVSRMLQRLADRLGLTHPIKFEDAKLIYHTCAFETAWHPKNPSPWCGLFSKEDLELLEYSEDLKYYWIDGYGFPLTYNQACVAFKDMFKHLTDESYPPYTFYFSHSGTMLKMLAHLGLYRDPEPLTAANMDRARLWRTSLIDAFSSNLAFVLFRCEDGPKVLTLHQERPVTIPGCPEALCPLSRLRDLYDHSLNSCNFNEACSLDS